MRLPTSGATIGRRETSDLLATTGIPPMPASAYDLRGDQPVLPLDPTIAEAAANALESGQTHYVDVPGIPQLREATARFLSEQGIPCRAANVLITAGVQEARFLALQILGEHIGAISLPDVVHPGVRQALGVRNLAHTLVPTDAARGHLIDRTTLQEALTTGCRLIYLESPVRLTGATYSQEELAAIAALATAHDAGIMIDHGLAPWSDLSHIALFSNGGLARTALLGELVPGMGLQSWQIGYIAADENWLPPLQSQKQIMSICTSTPSQYAALEAMEDVAGTREALRSVLQARTADARAVAGEVGLNPLPSTTHSIIAIRPRDVEAARTTLEAQGYSAADGAAFGAPGVLRLTIHPERDLAAVLQTLV